METVEYIWVNIRCMLIAPTKITEYEGSISPSSFYGQLLVTRFIVLSTQWVK